MNDERPQIVDELLNGPFPCCLTTLNRRGEPYGLVVWCAPDGDGVSVNGADGIWLNHLRRDPRVSLVIVDTRNILRHVAVQGRATSIEPDLDYAHIDALSRVYEGRPYAYSTPADVPRFRVLITADRIRTLDLDAPPS